MQRQIEFLLHGQERVCLGGSAHTILRMFDTTPVRGEHPLKCVLPLRVLHLTRFTTTRCSIGPDPAAHDADPPRRGALASSTELDT